MTSTQANQGKRCTGAIALGLLASFIAASPAAAQSVKVGNKEIQVHGFFQQGFALSSGNNVLTMKSKDGSFSMTDGGINVQSRLTSKLRVGAQAFSRNIGNLGNGQVILDWAFADYRFNDYFGVRGGKVKTTFGLFTDTQDMEFVHTWALLPQSMYPTDLRATTISHVGGDIYGDVNFKKGGRLSYTVFVGSRPEDRRGGYFLGTLDNRTPMDSYKTTMKGGDVRWTGGVEGLTMGYSLMMVGGYGTARLLNAGGMPFRLDFKSYYQHVGYADYQRGKFRTYGEYSHYDSVLRFTGLPSPNSYISERMWYVAGSYRLHKNVEAGSYYTSYQSERWLPFNPNNGIRGPVATVRFDINKYWNVKAEGHFMDGHGAVVSSRMFYLSANPNGLQKRTNLFLVRSAFSF